MKLRLGRFNHYFLVSLLAGLAGCVSTNPSARGKEESVLQFFVESPFDDGERTTTVMVCRSAPIAVRIQKAPVLDNRDLAEARIVDAVGGFLLQLRFTIHGSLVLEELTTAHRGSRLAIYGMFPNGRWLAAPVIPVRVTNGIVTFTPDLSRAESERLVRGLNNTAIRLKNQSKPGKTKKEAR